MSDLRPIFAHHDSSDSRARVQVALTPLLRGLRLALLAAAALAAGCSSARQGGGRDGSADDGTAPGDDAEVPWPICGNADCEPIETCETCPADCPLCAGCPSGVCDPTETCENCSADCGACGPVCGNSNCETGETCETCSGDCTDCDACPNDATNVALTDLLPAGLTFVSALPTQGAYDDVTGLWTVGTVTTATPDTLAITATVDPGTGGTLIVNTAGVTSADQADGNAANDSDAASISVATGPLALSSASDQVFAVGDPPTPIAALTIRDDDTVARIKAATDLRVRIPSGFPMTWDATDVTVTRAGTGAGAIAPTVSYEDGGRTLVLDVLVDFLPGVEVVISGLSFTAFSAAAAPARLELEVDNDGLVSALDDKTIAVLGPPTISSAASRIFLIGDPPSPISPVTITDTNGGTVTAVNDLRIRIPAGFPMTWFAADSVAAITGPAAAKVATTARFEDAGRTLVLDVLADFGPGDSITVSGLAFSGFLAAAAPAHLELELGNDGLVTATDDRTIAIAAPSLASAADRSFLSGDSPVPVAPITVTEDPTASSVTAAGNLRIRIPAGFPMSWNTADSSATFAGSAAAKVSPVVTYADAGRTLVLDVTADFSPGDVLTVSDLAFAAFGAPTGPARLELDVRGDGSTAAVDSRTVSIIAPTISSASYQNFVVGGDPVPMRMLTITDDPTTPTITAAEDLRIRIPTTFWSNWQGVVTTAVLGGSAAPKVSPAIAYEDFNHTMVLDVTADFVAGDVLTVIGPRFTGFLGQTNPDSLELEARNNGNVTTQDNRPIRVLAAGPTHSSAIAISADGSELWVCNPDQGSVSVIATQGAQANTLLQEIPVAPETWCVTLHPTNGEAWVTSQRTGRVYILDMASRTVVDSLAAGFETYGVAFDPSGMNALVTASGSDEFFIFDVPTRTIEDHLTTYRRPRGIAWRGDAQRAWVSHLLMPEFFGRLTTYFPSTNTSVENAVSQVFGTDRAGYPSTMQNLTIAPAPHDDMLWIPANMINTARGSLSGGPLTPQNIFHAIIRPFGIGPGGIDRPQDTYFLSDGGSPTTGFPGGTPVGGPVAVDFRSNRAYIANLNSDNVTVTGDDVLAPQEIAVIPAGKAPIGIVTHRSIARAYVANWLSRDVTVIDTNTNTVIATVPSTTHEVLPTAILNGKRLFFTSTGPMSLDGRGACASCHVWGTSDERPWDLSQFGKHIRATPDIRGIGFTGAHDWTADKNEMQDHNFGILEFTGGAGLIPGGGNPPLGPPNAGLSRDMDDIGRYMASLTHRTRTPFLLPDGSLTAFADSGRVLFNDPVVGCATCHAPPFFTDSRLDMPFVKHDVGTCDSTDTDGAAGFDTPSLIGVWDTAPYLHQSRFAAPTLEAVLTTYNPNDLHGTTSQLSSQQITMLADYLRSIAWPESTGTPVDAPVVLTGPERDEMHAVFPNPFREETQIRFSLERSPSRVKIEIYDVSGRRVRTLLDRKMTRGTHIVGWDSRNDQGLRVATGIYYARLLVDDGAKGTKKMVVLY